jgi:hypothetical protein
MHRDEQRSATSTVLPETPPKALEPKALEVVSEALSRLRYGAIQLTVHDGKVMQIDVTERKRLTD